MGRIHRRDFMKVAGVGLGAVAASSFFHDRLWAGTEPSPGSVFEERFGVTRMWDKLGQRVASPLVTISDDATLIGTNVHTNLPSVVYPL